MIPKKIHYCWYGRNPQPELLLRCRESWDRFCPDWEVKRWDENSTDMDNPYIRVAYENRNFANVSNCARLLALATEGGIYLDTDIELLKSLEPFRREQCFLGFQDRKTVNNAVMGAVQGHPFVEALVEEFLASFDGLEEAYLSSPDFVTDELRRRGLVEGIDTNKELVMVDGISLFPQRYFYPCDWDEKLHPSCIKEDTHAIHHWTKLWGEKEKAGVLAWLRNRIRHLLAMQ
jgi:hypothetical protein